MHDITATTAMDPTGTTWLVITEKNREKPNSLFLPIKHIRNMEYDLHYKSNNYRFHIYLIDGKEYMFDEKDGSAIIAALLPTKHSDGAYR